MAVAILNNNPTHTCYTTYNLIFLLTFSPLCLLCVCLWHTLKLATTRKNIEKLVRTLKDDTVRHNSTLHELFKLILLTYISINYESIISKLNLFKSIVVLSNTEILKYSQTIFIPKDYW